MAYSEDILHEVYEEVRNNEMKEAFDKQINKMGHQEKHRFKNDKTLYLETIDYVDETDH